MASRPTSILTIQGEAPPPYSEYDNNTPVVPAPNEETQALLRGGFISQAQQQRAQSREENGSISAYIRHRGHRQRHDNIITIARAIQPGIRIDGIPFPSEYPAIASRDVTSQDWTFFAGSIINELDVPAVKGAISPPFTLSEFRERQGAVDAVIDQWNRAFFAPRGIHVVPAYSFNRPASPTPTYHTDQTGEADEIQTITFDTSPRSSRVHTPDTLRELDLNDEGDMESGRLTPTSSHPSRGVPLGPEDTPEAPPGPPPTFAAHEQAPTAPFTASTQRQATGRDHLASEADGLEYAPPTPITKAEEAELERRGIFSPKKHLRRNSDPVSSASSASSSVTSFGSFSSDDILAESDVPAVRSTLAEEFRKDPRDWSHLKTSLAQIRSDVLNSQLEYAAAASRDERRHLRTVGREQRRAMKGEMRELRKEMKSYRKIAKLTKKDEKDNIRQVQREWRQDNRDARKAIGDAKKEAKKEADKAKKAAMKEALDARKAATKHAQDVKKLAEKQAQDARKVAEKQAKQAEKEAKKALKKAKKDRLTALTGDGQGPSTESKALDSESKDVHRSISGPSENILFDADAGSIDEDEVEEDSDDNHHRSGDRRRGGRHRQGSRGSSDDPGVWGGPGHPRHPHAQTWGGYLGYGGHFGRRGHPGWGVHAHRGGPGPFGGTGPWGGRPDGSGWGGRMRGRAFERTWSTGDNEGPEVGGDHYSGSWRGSGPALVPVRKPVPPPRPTASAPPGYDGPSSAPATPFSRGGAAPPATAPTPPAPPAPATKMSPLNSPDIAMPGPSTLLGNDPRQACPPQRLADYAGPLLKDPIGMARNFIAQQTNAGLERLRLDTPYSGPAPRAGEGHVYGAPVDDGQETGVVRK